MKEDFLTLLMHVAFVAAWYGIVSIIWLVIEG